MRLFLIASWLLSVGVVLGASDPLADQIRAAQSSGNYSEAAKLYLQLIAEGNDSPEIRSNCGVMLHLAGKNREALEQLQVALRQRPESTAANLFAGLSEYDLGNVKASLPYLTKAQQLDPERPGPLLALGKAQVALRDYRQAKELYTKAVARDSQLAEAWYGLGVTNRSLAEEILNRAARTGVLIDGFNKEELRNLLDDAVKALTRAVELEPNSARTHLLMAEALSDQGKLAEAVPEFHKSLNLDPGLEAAYLGLASEYWKDRQFEQAVPLLKHVLAKSPNDPEANAMMADILEHDGDASAALPFAQRALAGNPSLIQTHLVLARIYLKKDLPKMAISEIRKVATADPDGSYHFLLYRACHQAGDEPCAKDALAEFQRLRGK